MAVESLTAWLSEFLKPIAAEYPSDPAEVVAAARFNSHGMVYADVLGVERKM
jgi:hypothetical protein